MQITRKEYNGLLFDQLSITERISDALDKGEDKAREEIETIQRELKRKLYQKKPLVEE